MKAGILGASGYTGSELLRLLAGHPEFEVAVATAHSHAGEAVGAHTPSLAAAYPGLVYEENDPARFDGLDLVFCGLPHGESQRIVPELRARVGLVVDLAADFRLHDAALYPRWYGEEHAAPELLADAVYGLPELFRDGLAGATLVAAAGCYPTAAGLALAPLVRAGLVAADGHRRRRGLGRVGCRPRPQGVAALRVRRRGLHGLRAADPPPHSRDGADHRRRGALHAAPGADGARHPRHLLRPARRGHHSHDRLRHGRPARRLRRRAVRRRDRRPSLDQGHHGRQRRPRDARGSIPGPAGWSPCALWTTWSRARRARPFSAPTPRSACPRRTGLPMAGVYP